MRSISVKLLSEHTHVTEALLVKYHFVLKMVIALKPHRFC